MRISIEVAAKAQIVNVGFTVQVAAGGVRWSKSQLGDYADKSGVYILHTDGRILYVGKTTEGDYGTFGERLRRHFQEKASGNSLLQWVCTFRDDKPRFLLSHLSKNRAELSPGNVSRYADWHSTLPHWSSPLKN
jgi:hypothetical protein